MPQNSPLERIAPSLFDRLTDPDPRTKTDAPVPPWEKMQDLKRAVAADLANLLNVRHSDLDIPDEYGETSRSIAAYGIQDLSASPMDSEQVRRAIETSIRTFELRLTNVAVRFAPAANKLVMKFQISAVLRVDSLREPIFFEVVLPTHSRRFQLGQGR